MLHLAVSSYLPHGACPLGLCVLGLHHFVAACVCRVAGGGGVLVHGRLCTSMCVCAGRVFDRAGQVTGLSGAANLEEAIKDSNIVVIPAGVPRKPGMSRDDLFNTNASIVKALAEACAKACPKVRASAHPAGRARLVVARPG